MSFVVQSARALKVKVQRNRKRTCILRPFRPTPKRDSMHISILAGGESQVG